MNYDICILFVNVFVDVADESAAHSNLSPINNPNRQIITNLCMSVRVSVYSSLNAMCDITGNSDDVLSSHLAKCQTEAET